MDLAKPGDVIAVRGGTYAVSDNNVFSRLSTHDIYESGFQLQGSSSNNQILDLDTYGNRGSSPRRF
ncbi:hypothetical protein [Streptomyces cyaneochromogenes]|uniref:hypothetical protein n=1 Tax=Streptomyces cyaneochromogenes TaxID=2496836 RepID=UPI00225DEADA|nr:hypothetical protein [Streptomyces cyaneochromogenes]